MDSHTTTQWPQGIGVNVIEKSGPGNAEKKESIRAEKELKQPLNCRRCSSSNTKFCYYNNYSLSQPRYFCKACRRYWTEGGTLRNVPVGGGSRKNLHKRSSFSNSNNCPEQPLTKKSSSLINITSPPPLFASHNQNPRIDHHLNLGFNPYQFGIQNPSLCNQNHHHFLPVMPPVPDHGGLLSVPSGLNNPVKTSLGLPVVEEINGAYVQILMADDHYHRDQTNLSSSSSSRAGLSPYEEVKAVPLSNEFGQERGQGGTSGYWINGMLAGGSW